MAILKKKSSKTNSQNDDALFIALGKSKKRKRRKIIITVVAILLVLAIAAITTVNMLQKKVRDQFASTTSEVLSYSVATGTISTVVSGSGTLKDVDLEYIKVPAGVEITEVMSKTNDSISEGDIIATVNMASVMSAMADLQTEIESLDKQLSEAEDDEASDTITAGVSGRVKIIYAEEGEDVADVMYEDGALAVLSLDGYMAVEIETDKLNVGDSMPGEQVPGEQVPDATTTPSEGIQIPDGTAVPSEGEQTPSGTDSGAGMPTGSGSIDFGNITIPSGSASGMTGATGVAGASGMTGYYQGMPTTTEEDAEYYDLSIAEIASVTPQNTIKLNISVNELDINLLSIGMEAEIKVNAFSSEKFTATISDISNTGTNNGGYSYFTVELVMDRNSNMLAGMNATASIVVASTDEVTSVPVEALVENGTKTIIYTGYDEQNATLINPVTVEIGVSDGKTAEITSGLTAGSTYYYEYYDTLEVSNTPDMASGGFGFGMGR